MSDQENIKIHCANCNSDFDKEDLQRSCANCFACTNCEIYICANCRSGIVVKPMKERVRKQKN